MTTTQAEAVLSSIETVLLVDWPGTHVPRSLLEVGKTVYGFSPGGYSQAELSLSAPAEADGVSSFPAEAEADGFLVFRRVGSPPKTIDLVCVYRPAEELPKIIEGQVVPLGAKTLWLQPPITSTEARDLAIRHDVDFVEGIDIAEIAREL